MSDQDRGAYTPQTDTPLSFDARYSRGSGERPLPMTLIISGVVLVVLILALVLFYRSGVRHSGQSPEVVGAPVADTKAPASAGADSSDTAAGLQVYKSEGTPATEMKPATTLAPPPEEPAPRPAPAPKPVAQSELRPAQPEAAPAPVAAAPTQTAPVAPAPKPVVKPAAKSAPPPQTIDAAVDQSTAAGATSMTGSVAQIGAFSSQALAEKGWNDVAAMQPGKMAGKTKRVEVATRDGKTFYRAFVGGFASKADAASFCASLVAAGKGCIVK